MYMTGILSPPAEKPGDFYAEIPDIVLASIDAIHALSRRGSRKSTKSDSHTKIIAALTKHHKYNNDSCLETRPIGCNELAKLAGVAKSSVSRFFSGEFGGYRKYVAQSQTTPGIIALLKLLNGEFTPEMLSGRDPE